jgi:hypothetical protein
MAATDAASDAAILRALLGALGGGAPEAAALGGFDAQRVLAVARHHRVSALLGAARPAGLDAALAERFHRDFAGTVGRNALLQLALEECLGRFGAAGLQPIVLKGLAYQEALYGPAAARPTGDVDLLVPPHARDPAFRALADAGFTPVAAAPGFDQADYHEVEWRRGAIFIDLHFALAPPRRAAIDGAAVWAARRPLRVGGAAAWQLGAAHAAVFHALHMAIHHFDVPALYLVDLSRLAPDAAAGAAAAETARGWRCARAWRTSVALAARFLPGWPAAHQRADGGAGAVAARVAGAYGAITPLPRAEQLRRKVEHFDRPTDAIAYLLLQGRRAIREQALRRFTRRSAAERLGVDVRRGGRGTAVDPENEMPPVGRG